MTSHIVSVPRLFVHVMAAMATLHIRGYVALGLLLDQVDHESQFLYYFKFSSRYHCSSIEMPAQLRVIPKRLTYLLPYSKAEGSFHSLLREYYISLYGAYWLGKQ